MGHLPFNLITLQLVAPTANMTKAEYKDAFGIDLDDVNIKAFKLVLFGGEKYAIDQIKEVEDGIEIYFNGRIMSITDIVQVSDEVYDVANSKPLYFHPITISNSADNPTFVASIIIVNNSSDPIDTWSKLTTFFNQVFDSLPTGISDARFPCTGFVKNASKTIVCSVIVITGKTDAARIFSGINLSTSSHDSMSGSDIPGVPNVVDGVNKIN